VIIVTWGTISMNNRLRTMAAPATAVISLGTLGALALPAHADAGFTHRIVPGHISVARSSHGNTTGTGASPRSAQAVEGCQLSDVVRAHQTGYCAPVGVHVYDRRSETTGFNNVSFVLCEGAEAPLARSNDVSPDPTCPDGYDPVASGQSSYNDDDAAGYLLFDGEFSCAAQYVVVPDPTTVPSGYTSSGPSPSFIPEGDCDSEDPYEPYPLDASGTQAPALPVARDDAAATPEGTPVVIDVLANDTPAVSGSTLDITNVGSPKDGTATATPSTGQAVGHRTAGNPARGRAAATAQKVTYTPKAGFTGTDTFPYTVTDPVNGQTATANVTVHVTRPKVIVVPAAPVVTATPSPSTKATKTKRTHSAATTTHASSTPTATTQRSTSSADTLPFTGAPIETDIAWGMALLASGAFLTVAGTRRRRPAKH
jgi:hypothetical protein